MHPRARTHTHTHIAEKCYHVISSQVQTLTDAVDEITTVESFLAVSEAHILEDVTSCVVALQQSNAEMLDRKGGDIRGRTARICDVSVLYESLA